MSYIVRFFYYILHYSFFVKQVKTAHPNTFFYLPEAWSGHHFTKFKLRRFQRLFCFKFFQIVPHSRPNFILKVSNTMTHRRPVCKRKFKKIYYYYCCYYWHEISRVTLEGLGHHIVTTRVPYLAWNAILD